MTDNNIISELSVISAHVAAIPVRTPYTVPQNYFETFPDTVHDRIASETFLHNSPLMQLHRLPKDPFRVPDGYFDNLSTSILNRILASEAATPLQEVQLLSPLLAGLKNKTPFSTPAGYFESLSPAVSSGSREQADSAEESLSPLLRSLRDRGSFQVPAGYFDSFAAKIVEQVRPAAPAKVIPFGFGRKIIRYAVAASIAAVVAYSGWFYQHRPASDAAAGGLAGIKNASNQELQDFIDKNTVILPESGSSPSDDLKPEDVKTMLAGVTDDELQQYLDQQPNLKDPAVNNFN